MRYTVLYFTAGFMLFLAGAWWGSAETGGERTPTLAEAARVESAPIGARVENYERTLKEYEVLSEDRRAAVTIFANAIFIAAGFLAVVFAWLEKARGSKDVIVRGTSGLLLLIFFTRTATQCRQHGRILHDRLSSLSASLGMGPVYSIDYIFADVVWLALLVTVIWVAICGCRLWWSPVQKTEGPVIVASSSSGRC